jgi:hypothetical protein
MIISALVITLIWLQNLSQKHGTFRLNGAFFKFIFTLYPYTGFLSNVINF